MSEQSNNWDVIVIGGGAAGLLAAASAGERGKRVLLLEKNKKMGVKILMSGGSRCNITHDCGIPGIIEAFGRPGKFLHSALAALPPSEVIKKIEAQGVATKTESTGKIFPVSNRAIDVRDALVAMAVQVGTVIETECPVLQIDHHDRQFHVVTARATFTANSIVITTGGKSYPGCGTTGDGYAWAERFGHSIVDTFPALTPILSNGYWTADLKGITVERVHVRVIEPGVSADPAKAVGGPSETTLHHDWHAASRSDYQAATGSTSPLKNSKPKILAQREGSFLFTHWGFSGPSILDVSREVARHPSRNRLELGCDFLPGYSEIQLLEYLKVRKSNIGKQTVGNLLHDFFPNRLQAGILTAAEIPLTIRNAELTSKSLAAITQQIKQSRFPISGTLGFEKAEVTSGGVNLAEVDSKTMRSKRMAGLFFAGEILDLDGRIGGFNFQSAFSTGWLAGQWA